MRQPEKITFIPATRSVTAFVYDTMPAGSRCAWACKWVTSQGIVQPGDWGALEDMTPEEIAAELADLIARNVPGAKEQAESHARGHVLKWIRQAREHYPEYVYPFDPPKTGYNIQYRPGWLQVQVGNAWQAI